MRTSTLNSDGSWSTRDMTTDEVNEYNTTIAAAKAKKDAMEAAVAKKETDRTSAKIKLKALGLTDDEVEALSGS